MRRSQSGQRSLPEPADRVVAGVQGEAGVGGRQRGGPAARAHVREEQPGPGGQGPFGGGLEGGEERALGVVGPRRFVGQLQRTEQDQGLGPRAAPIESVADRRQRSVARAGGAELGADPLDLGQPEKARGVVAIARSAPLDLGTKLGPGAQPAVIVGRGRPGLPAERLDAALVR